MLGFPGGWILGLGFRVVCLGLYMKNLLEFPLLLSAGEFAGGDMVR